MIYIAQYSQTPACRTITRPASPLEWGFDWSWIVRARGSVIVTVYDDDDYSYYYYYYDDYYEDLY